MIGKISLTSRKLILVGRISLIYCLFTMAICLFETSPNKNLGFVAACTITTLILGFILPEKIVLGLFRLGFICCPVFLMIKSESEIISIITTSILLVFGIIVSKLFSVFLDDSVHINENGDNNDKEKSIGDYFIISFVSYLILLVFVVPGNINFNFVATALGIPLLLAVFYVMVHGFLLQFWFYNFNENNNRIECLIVLTLFTIYFDINKTNGIIFSFNMILLLIMAFSSIIRKYEETIRESRIAEEIEKISTELF